MDRETKLSFIPKKPLARSNLLESRPVSLFLTISFSLLVITMAVYGGFYFYTDALKKEIVEKKTTLEEARKKFDLSIVEKAKSFKSQIETAQGLIDGHIALSSLLDFLGGATLQRDALLREVEKKNLASVSVGEYKLDPVGNVGFGWKAVFNTTPFLYKNAFAGVVSAVPSEEVTTEENAMSIIEEN